MAPALLDVAEIGSVAPRKYYTMADIAARTGVHPTTVSLALRGHPSIPLRTRLRISSVAKDFGYQRNPMLDALNLHRLKKTPKARSVCSAFVVHAGTTHLYNGGHFQPMVYAGAKAAAAACGHSLEIFVVGAGHLTPARLNAILDARGINTVLVSTFDLSMDRLDLDWSRYSAVKIESQHLTPQLDVVTNDQLQSAQLAMRQLRLLGYRRIGLVTTQEDQARVAESFSMGVRIEQASLPKAEIVAPFIFRQADAPLLPEQIPAWIRANQVDALISDRNELKDVLAGAKISVPQEVALASLDVSTTKPHEAGVVQNHALVGQRAFEQLAVMAETHQRGIPKVQTITCVPGRWQDGSTAPKKA